MNLKRKHSTNETKSGHVIIDLKKLRLIIFDLDDTLIDNREVDYQSFALTCQAHQIHAPSRNRLLHYRNQGMTAEEIIHMLWGEKHLPVLNQIKKQRLKLLASGDLWLHLALPFPGVVNLLKDLERKKIQVAIVTIRKNRRLIEQLLKKIDCWKCINFLFCGDDMPDLSGLKTHVGDAFKFKKAGYKKAMKNFKVESKQTLVIGDDPDELRAALDLHMSCVRVRNPYKDSLFGVATKRFPVIETIVDLIIAN